MKNLINKRFTFAKDNVDSSFAPWHMLTYSVVQKSLSKFILECQQHGFINFLERKYWDFKWLKNTKTDPKVLTMYMLSAGFYIWLVCVAIACIVFALEHAYKFYSDRYIHYRSNVTIIDELE